MELGLLSLVAVTFILAGFVKGMIGMGLPTVAMGLLALAMPPVEAAAVLVVPSFVTNVWQLLAGPSFKALALRLWLMMVGIVVGTVGGTGILVGDSAGIAGIGLGCALAVYALTGLAGLRLPISPSHERWMGPVVGVTTGLVTGATGVFVLPAVPYLQAIGLDREDLIQALGLSFTVSTIALALGLLRTEAWSANSFWISIAVLAPALAGMLLGQALRQRLSAVLFRRVFFCGLLLLGVYLALRGIA